MPKQTKKDFFTLKPDPTKGDLRQYREKLIRIFIKQIIMSNQDQDNTQIEKLQDDELEEARKFDLETIEKLNSTIMPNAKIIDEKWEKFIEHFVIAKENAKFQLKKQPPTTDDINKLKSTSRFIDNQPSPLSFNTFGIPKNTSREIKPLNPNYSQHLQPVNQTLPSIKSFIRGVSSLKHAQYAASTVPAKKQKTDQSVSSVVNRGLR